MTLQYKRLSVTSRVPSRATPDSVGYDLYTPINFVLFPGERRVVYTDLAFGIPPGHYGRIASKSSIATKYTIDVNAGVIDRDYRGNVGVVLTNNSSEKFYRYIGEPIAQLILERASVLPLEEVTDLAPTIRASHGFGQGTPLQNTAPGYPQPLWQPFAGSQPSERL